MSPLKKKRGADDDDGCNGKKFSSYAQLKCKCTSLTKEVDNFRKEGNDLRMEKELLERELFGVRNALEVTQRNNVQVLGLFDQLCIQKEEEKSVMDALVRSLRDENIKLQQRLGLHHIRLEQLKRTITTSSDAYDALFQKCEQLEETIQRQVDVQKVHNKSETKRKVCNAFGWSDKSADPVLLRAACAFWDGCSNVDHDGTVRVSFKTRLEIWLEIAFRGFKGEAMDALEKAFKKASKFDVVELARRSDVKVNSMRHRLVLLRTANWVKKNTKEDCCVVMQHFDVLKNGFCNLRKVLDFQPTQGKRKERCGVGAMRTVTL
jgi:hypothetical protein